MSHLSYLLGALNGLPENEALIVMIVGSIACVFWLIVYAKSIVQSYQQKTNCIPVLAICLNVTWELLASTVFADQTPIPGWLWLERAWLLFDLVILAQLLAYGAKNTHNPLVDERFYLVTVVTLLLCTGGHYTFRYFCGEEPVMLPDALVINAFMSFTFPFMLYRRPKLRGISLTIAWCKMLGTLCNTIAMYWYMPFFYPNANQWPFMWFLCGSIFLLDCVYIYLVTRAKRAAATAGTPVAQTA